MSRPFLLGLAGRLDRLADAEGTPHAACAIVTTATTDALPSAAEAAY